MPTKNLKFTPIVVSMGDPAGVGPEVVHVALRESKVLDARNVFVVGDVMAYARAVGNNKELHNYHILPYDDFVAAPVEMMEEFAAIEGERNRPYFLDVGRGDEGIEIGQGSPESGEAAYISFMAALELIDMGVSETLVTGPLSKFWVSQAGADFDGHTEVLGKILESEPVMTFVGGGLRVALVTTHFALSDVPGKIKRRNVEAITRHYAESLMTDYGIENPRIAVCGLNPHAGEGGRFGTEDKKVIEPVVESLQAEGMRVQGPFAADTLFLRALKGEFDGVVSMYHDQGLTPVKLLSAGHAVNVTANLPIVRTSPDHGTAYDIAGTGKADALSMRNAVELADAISRRRSGEKVSSLAIERAPDAQLLRQTRSGRSGRYRST